MIIYTIIPYLSNGVDINRGGIKSFKKLTAAYEYGDSLNTCFDTEINELVE